MIHPRIRPALLLTALLAFAAVFDAGAQQRQGGGGGGFGGFGGGGFGGFGGGGGGGGRAAGGTGSRQYYGNGQVGEAVISSDPETRRLIIITDDETGAYVSQVITNLDRPKPQVLIKVVFLEVTWNNSSDIGIEGAYQNKKIGNGAIGTFANAFGLSALSGAATGQVNNAFGQPVQSFTPVPPGAGLYQIMGSDYQATLRAIATAGKAEVLSRPSILARNNQPATITVGQSVPLVTNVRFDNFGNAINSVSYQSVGIILRVTPFINADGMVEMIVQPETSELAERSQWVNIANGAQAPVINSRSADTVVVTPDRQTVIIGGLMQKAKSRSESKIPLLGDIPGLGNLFKRKARTDSKTELIIFLTPQIVAAPTQIAALTAAERSKAELAPKTFTEDELNKFLDTVPVKPAEPVVAPELPPAPEKKKKIANPPRWQK